MSFRANLLEKCEKRRPVVRTVSELSPLNPPANQSTSREEGNFYGSTFSSYLGGFRRNKKSHSAQTLNRCESMGAFGYRTLLQYVESNDLQGLKTLLDTRHLPVDDRDENQTTVLMVCATRGMVSFVRELIARGADVQAEDIDNWTPLLCAAKEGHADVVQLLLEHDANQEHRDMGGWSALMWSSYKGHTDVVALLLQRGADVHAHGNYHLGPLLWAAGRGHKEIVEMLVQRGAKVNVGDKYGTTALVWACRKGNAEIVDILLKAGANVDNAGMYSWTPLLVSVAGGHQECVTLLLEKRPNVNALDKDGLTALSIACREGLQDTASALIAAGAYVNIQDRAGDTPLIHAVKGGHRGVVEALLKRHVDIDIQGKERKTALYTAVEKGHTLIVKLLLASNPDVELATKDGDTPLLRAVRNRHLDIVHMLLEKKAKVSAVDRRGDTCLHIAMRARSKAIVEALLRNPKNSKLLYRANKAGETPYGLDTVHQKTILGQVFGARPLNTNEDSEGMLGYELYSSALADVLSEPTLTTPITVGLYAKWGSGKSFLLSKLRDEMKSFARQWAEPPIKAPWLLFTVCLHVCLLLGIVVSLSTWSYVWGISAAGCALVLFYVANLAIKFASRRYDINWAYSFHHGLMKRIGRLRLIMQVAFCHPPGSQGDPHAMPVRFHFAEASSAAPNGEGAVGHMLASLFEAIESHYGSLPTRLFRAFRPKHTSSSHWRWRRMCCMPLILLFELAIAVAVTGTALLILYLSNLDTEHDEAILIAIYALGSVLLVGFVGNLHSWAKAVRALFFSQGRQLKKAMTSADHASLTALGAEVSLMADMIKCLDAFTGQQSRLVGVVDALDSCDTERTLTMLNAIQTLLSSPNRPFVLLLAVDPHVIAKAAEANSRRLFTEGGIGGHDFLRNLVHLPVYLQNSGLRKVQRAQNTALAYRRNTTDAAEDPILSHSASARRLSNASEIMSSQEKLRAPPGTSRGGSKKLRLSESVASSIGSNLHRVGQNPQGTLDMSKILLTDDYFSDVNPRSMRRLMNVIYITVRLLKAFQIDFSWYRLSSWINLTEQWPVRASMIVLQHDQNGDSLDDSTSLQSVYDKVRPKISCLREAAALLELDRDERKLDAFLQLHKADLLVADLRIFLPFTINLDPYLRKVLKEDQQAMEDEGIIIPLKPNIPLNPRTSLPRFPQPYPPYQNIFAAANPAIPVLTYQSYAKPPPVPTVEQPKKKIQSQSSDVSQTALTDILTNVPANLHQIRLSKLNVSGLSDLLQQIDELRPALDSLLPALKQHSISGRVLMHCDLQELKNLLNLSFGHWEIFRLLIITLRNLEKQQPTTATVRVQDDDAIDSQNIQPPTSSASSYSRQKPQSIMEKQVTLEEQMICGALQTLNEEAFEDVVGSERGGSGEKVSDGQIGRVSPSSSWSASPSIVRREPILRPRGSVKSEKKVSIKNEVPINIEYIAEKRHGSTGSFAKILSPGSAGLPAGRPTTFVYATKNEKSEQAEKAFKMTRSYSFDNDSLDKGIELKDISGTPAGSMDEEVQPLVNAAPNKTK
ncbi:kinase D-interacting substrate of 220 kDa isoform X2 [Lutzomyia longipalpis]|uniref:kinase D-interacting substrate of 220 kDa isoform X2 n=1 Tax=Lutzomyia longipalpis TaxID=7200 RepID=UPI002483DD5C|nr:kinase D-interacting substrate of 220 kDa isoform X2 [Lutzomyia longipalpis]